MHLDWFKTTVFLQRATKDIFSYLILSWSPLIPEFPGLFVDMAPVEAAFGAGINHMAGRSESQAEYDLSQH